MICHGPRAAVSDVDGPCNRSRSAGHRVGVRPGARSCPSQHRRRTERPERRDAERRKAPWSRVIYVHYTREQWYVLFEDECVYIYMCKAPEHVLGSSSAARVQGSGRRPVPGVKGRSRSGTSLAWTVVILCRTRKTMTIWLWQLRSSSRGRSGRGGAPGPAPRCVFCPAGAGGAAGGSCFELSLSLSSPPAGRSPVASVSVLAGVKHAHQCKTRASPFHVGT